VVFRYMDNEKSTKRGLPASSIVAIVFLVLIMYFFVTGGLYKFYASALFLFYSFTQNIWVSVVLLGVFQTILLVPFRIIRLLDFKNIRDFQAETLDTRVSFEQESYLKRQFRQGNWTFTFYMLDFVVQLSTYMTIGRLFLTNFYTKALDPKVLFSFVKYPEYPILERFFKIPYPHITKTIDLGFESVLYFWLIIIVVEILISIFISARNAKNTREGSSSSDRARVRLSSKYLVSYGVIMMVVSYFLMRNFPVGIRLSIFSGDVAFQNSIFNTVTAIATFITLMWFGVNDIIRKGKIAREMGISQGLIDSTQTKMFKESFSRAVLIGLGAYFITNQIPCAFELSIFTLEVISLFSPLTLDKWILKAAPKKEDLVVDRKSREELEVLESFQVK